MSKNYLDSVSAAFSEAKAWKTTTLVLGLVSMLLTVQLVNQARNRPVVLVPYATATDSGRVEVTTSGELAGTSAEYMANLATLDLGMILTFNPDTVLTSTKRFLNRTSDSLYQKTEADLLARAADYKTRGVTQSFFPADIRVSSDSRRVEVTGKVLTTIAQKQIQDTTVTYVLTYEAQKGYPRVASITQAQGGQK